MNSYEVEQMTISNLILLQLLQFNSESVTQLVYGKHQKELLVFTAYEI